MKNDLTIFFRCHPTTPQSDLSKLENKSNLVLWIHGGKFTPEETAILAKKAAKAKIKSALDLGQKTRIERIHEAEMVGSSGTGKMVKAGSTIVLAHQTSYETNLPLFEKSWPGTIIAQVNRLPKIKTTQTEETAIHFGEGEVICQIDSKRTVADSHIFLTVFETKLGKLFSDHGVIGGTYSLEESRGSVLGSKDIACLKANKSSDIQYLILSLVTSKQGILDALKTIDEVWPGWRKKKDNRIILKLETVSAVENIEDILTIDKGNTIYMVGLGDLGVATRYKGWELDSTLKRLLLVLDQYKKQVIVANGIGLSILPPDSFKVLEWSKEKLTWLERLLAAHPSIYAVGMTSESIRASQRNILGEFLTKVRKFS